MLKGLLLAGCKAPAVPGIPRSLGIWGLYFLVASLVLPLLFPSAVAAGLATFRSITGTLASCAQDPKWEVRVPGSELKM